MRSNQIASPKSPEQSSQLSPEQTSEVSFDAQTTASKMEEIGDQIPIEILQVIELFANELKNVPFPDISDRELAARLTELRRAQDAVANAAIALRRAESEAATQLQALRDNAARGLAYAGIYAAADVNRTELAKTIQRLGASRLFAATTATNATSNAPGKRRARKASGTGVAPLFDEAATDGIVANEHTSVMAHPMAAK